MTGDHDPTDLLNSGELIGQNETILFPNAGMAIPFVIQDTKNLRPSGIIDEYLAIGAALEQVLGMENITMLDIPVITLADNMRAKINNLPEELRQNSVDASALNPLYASFPRNTVNKLGQRYYANPKGWQVMPDGLIPSLLGDGGMSISFEGFKGFLATPALYEECRDDIHDLQSEGIQCAVVPLVDPAHQEFPFQEEDIDGHSKLLLNQRNGIDMVVDATYMFQGNNTGPQLKNAAKALGVELIIADCSNEPPHPLNFLQLHNGVVIKSRSLDKPRPSKFKGRFPTLEQVLANRVGPRKIHRTRIPIVEMPIQGNGSIYCMTNIAPKWIQLS